MPIRAFNLSPCANHTRCSSLPSAERTNELFRLPYLPELIARKLAGPEHCTLDAADVAFHRRESERLRATLEQAHRHSNLLEAPTARAALDDLLIRVRLAAGT